MKTNSKNSGVALVTVVCFLALTSAIIAIMLSSTVSHYRMSSAMVDMEMALHVAEAGTERAVAYVASGGNAPATLNGSLGKGSYETTILASDAAGNVFNGQHIIAGEVNLNPNNNPNNQFTMTLQDGTTISRDDLHQNYPGYNGKANFIHFTPKGNGNQNTMFLDGAIYDLQNGNDYDITAQGMDVSLYNDHINAQGKAMGKWWLSISGVNVRFVSSGGDVDSSNWGKSFNIVSVGTVNGTARRVTLTGLRNMSWAQYALWSNNNRDIYFKSGEEFDGPVHANSRMWFSGDPHFYDTCTSSANNYGGNINNVTFDKGFDLNVPAESMASVPFDDLKSEAATGNKSSIIGNNTYITLDGDDIYKGTRQPNGTITYVLLENSQDELIYVEGDLYIAGQLDGRRTFVTDGNIYITNHLTYANDPKVDPTSNDALGLLSKKDIIVTQGCPDNLTIYAHMMATGVATATNNDGSFRVDGYNNGAYRGDLTVHGGIVQHYRGAVGTFNTGNGLTTTGFDKNYTFDSRFAIDPPPFYPTLDDQYTWENWSESAL